MRIGFSIKKIALILALLTASCSLKTSYLVGEDDNVGPFLDPVMSLDLDPLRTVWGSSVWSADTTPRMHGMASGTGGGRIFIYEDAACSTLLVQETVASNGSFDITSVVYTLAHEGWRPYYIRSENAEGLENPSGCMHSGHEYILDLTPPIVEILSPITNTYVITGGTVINGSCEDGGSDITLTGNIVTPVTTACVGGNFSTTVSFLPTPTLGIRNLTASQSDLVGHIGTDSISYLFDSVAPIVTISSPTLGGYVNDLGSVITGTCETGSGNVVLSGDVVTTVSSLCVAGNYTATVTFLSAPSTGSRNLIATQSDGVGNVGTANASYLFDSDAPTVTIVNPVTGSQVTNLGTVITGTCETASGNVTLVGDILTTVTTSCSAGNFLTNVTFVNLPLVGARNLMAMQTDAAGNLGSATAVYLYDSEAPVVNIATPLTNSYVNDSGTTITGTCETGLLVTLSGDLMSLVTTSCVGGNFSTSVTFVSTPLTGPRSITASQTDDFGNTGTDTEVYLYDSEAPIVAIQSPLSGDPVTSLGTVITGTCETGAGVVTLTGDITIAVTSPCILGAFIGTVFFNTTPSTGPRILIATQIDGNGNSGSDTETYNYDDDAPVVQITSPASGVYVDDSGTLISGLCEDGGSQVSLSGNIVAPVTASCVGGSFSANVNFLSSPTTGTRSLTASQTDGFGNTGTDNEIYLYDIDPPVVTITTPASGGYVSSGSTSVLGTCETGSGDVTLTGNISAPVSVNCVAGSYLANVEFLNAPLTGSRTLTASQTDAAGNTGSATASYLYDSEAPLVAIVTPTGGTYVTDAGTAITGTCENGSGDVSLTGNIIAPVTVPCAAGEFSANVTFLSLPSTGTRDLIASQTDAAGNTGVDVESYLYDGEPPVVTIVTPTGGNYVSDTGTTITGTCENGSGDVSLSGDISAPVFTACSGGIFSAIVTFVSAPSTGPRTLTASQTDTNGNTGSDSEIYNYDTDPPLVEITSPIAGNYVTNSGTAISGICENGSGDITLGGDISPSMAVACMGGSFTANVTFVSTPTVGTRTLTASQTDAAGNTGTTSEVYLYDSVPPLVTILSPVGGTYVTSAGTVVTGTCEDGSGSVNLTGDIVSPVSVICSAGTYSANLNFLSLPTLGTRNLTASQMDDAGNIGSASESYLYDSIPPLVTIENPMGSTYVTDSGTAITGLCEIGSGNVTLSGDIVASVITACAGGSYSASVTFLSLPSIGPRTLTASQTDGSGNTGSDTEIYLFDSVPPLVTITSPLGGTYVTDAGTIITGTCESASGNENVMLTGNISTPVSVACIGNSFSANVTFVSTPPLGTRSLTASQTDAAGNTGSDSESYLFDSVSPTVTINTPASSTYVTDLGTAITGTCENGSGNVTLTGDISAPVITACSSGNFSANVTFLSSPTVGTRSLTASQTDGAGNTGSDTATYLFDSVAPLVNIVSPVDNVYVTNLGTTISGTCENGSGNVTLSGDISGSVITACSGGNFSASVNFLNSPSTGTRNLMASQTDPAGNTGSDTASYLYDADPPLITITQPLDNTDHLAGAVITIQGTCESSLTVTLSGTALVSGATTSCTGGVFTHNVTLQNFAALDRTIVATQTDAAGNIGSDSILIDLLIHCAGVAMSSCSIGGDGTLANPYQVSTIACLQEMRTGLSCHYRLANNIDASATTTWNSGRGWIPVGPFSGSLNGQNHQITNLYMNRPNGEEEIGLFTQILSTHDPAVSNLTLHNVNVNAGARSGTSGTGVYVGAIAGRLMGVIRNVHLTGTVNVDANISNGTISGNQRRGFRVGGFVGADVSSGANTFVIEDSSITGSGAATSLIGANSSNIEFILTEDINRVGGFVGQKTLSGAGNRIRNSFVSQVRVQSTGNYVALIAGTVGHQVGGLLGGGAGTTLLEDSQILSSEINVAGNVGSLITANSGHRVGGIIGGGNHTATITRCAAEVDITMAGNGSLLLFHGHRVGGIAGHLSDSTILDSYMRGSFNTSGVTDAIGTAVGHCDNASVTNFYSAAVRNTSGSVVNSGLVAGTRVGTCAISNSRYNTTLSGAGNVCGQAGCTITNTVGLTSTLMRQQAQFPGVWDFVTDWGINEGIDFPFLR